jgi:hypothetical protein
VPPLCGTHRPYLALGWGGRHIRNEASCVLLEYHTRQRRLGCYEKVDRACGVLKGLLGRVSVGVEDLTGISKEDMGGQRWRLESLAE